MKLKITSLVFISLLFLFSACSNTNFSEAEWEKETESVKTEDLYISHKSSTTFFNPWIDMDKGFGDFLTWKFSESQVYTEEEKRFLPKVYTDAKQQLLDHPENDFILWIGHGSFLIKTGNQVWLLDPMFSERALLPARLTPPAITAEEINTLFPELNVVISHNHYDHLDENSIKDLSENYVYYVPLGLKGTIQDWQPNTKIIEMDWWDKLKTADGYEIHCLPAQHWSNRVFDGRNSSLWASFMIVSPESNIYFGGDSGYFMGYKEFGKKYPKIDYALIPTTAYHPRWFMHEAHMNIEESIQAFQDLKADYFVPTQWGTFSLGNEPAGYPGLDLKRTIQAKQLDQEKYLILDIGELYTMR